MFLFTILLIIYYCFVSCSFCFFKRSANAFSRLFWLYSSRFLCFSSLILFTLLFSLSHAFKFESSLLLDLFCCFSSCGCSCFLIVSSPVLSSSVVVVLS